MEDYNEDKEELIEMLSIHFQNQYSLSPLGAKIWAVLIMDGNKDGLTFEYLVERMKASKSTVSTNLNMLLELERIYFETKEGDRKKYFKAAPFSERFVRILKNIEFEKLLIEKMIQYKSNNNNQCNKAKCDLENIKAYQNHLIEMEKLTYKIMSDLKQIEEKNKKTIQ
jgi:DNA-binding transcriptional regulator GbsR (MarR family)